MKNLVYKRWKDVEITAYNCIQKLLNPDMCGLSWIGMIA